MNRNHPTIRRGKALVAAVLVAAAVSVATAITATAATYWLRESTASAPTAAGSRAGPWSRRQAMD